MSSLTAAHFLFGELQSHRKKYAMWSGLSVGFAFRNLEQFDNVQKQKPAKSMICGLLAYLIV